MTRLSFIALFFYLGALFPAAQLSADHNWLDTPQRNPVFGLSLLSSSAQPIKHLDVSGDSANAPVQWHPFAIAPVVSDEYPFVVSLVYATTTLSFSARAPPLILS